MLELLKKLRDYLLLRIIWRKHQIGINFHAGPRVSLWKNSKLIIGHHFFIGRDSEIHCDAKIGNYVMLGNKVGLVGKYDHNYQQVGVPTILASRIIDTDYNWKGISSKVIIEDDVWVGYGSIILTGVKIGQGSIIAAGSVVISDVEPYSIYGGVPAKKLRDRFENHEDLRKHIDLFNQKYKNIKK